MHITATARSCKGVNHAPLRAAHGMSAILAVPQGEADVGHVRRPAASMSSPPESSAAKRGEVRASHLQAGKHEDIIDAAPFSGGPLYRMQGLLGIVRPKSPNVLCRAVGAMAVCWLPLALMNILPGYGNHAFWSDFGTHARYLAAVPLLIIAEGICVPRMNALACQFFNGGAVKMSDRSAFVDLLASTQRAVNHAGTEVAVIFLAYLCIASLVASSALNAAPLWLFSSERRGISPAGWWGMLVSLPLLLCLFLGWLWRIGLWIRFLHQVSRFDLRLIPAHPDGAAGIGFVGYSSQAFTVLAMAYGALVAGAVANGIYVGATLVSYHYLILSFIAGVVLFFNLPLLVFLGKMLQAWRRGTLEYGALADKFGVVFEKRWLREKPPSDESMLEQQDFSAATDLYQVIDRVYAMWLLPIHPKSVIMLAIAALLPFLPVALMAVPFTVIVDKLTGLMF